MNEINIWDECLRAFDDVLTDKDMKTWFLPLEGQAKTAPTLRVIAPNRFIRDQIESEYLTLIKKPVAL
jgi:ATPase involved in DNA replication initiation